MRRRAARVQDPADQVHRISAAPHAHSDDLSTRMSRYLISMAIRTVCVVLLVVVDGPLRWVFAVGAVGLPYIAVVMANTGQRARDPQLAPPTPGRATPVGAHPVPTPTLPPGDPAATSGKADRMPSGD